MFTVQLGISPINWCNDDIHELGKDISLDTCLTEMKESGYSGTEIGHKFPKNVAVLSNILNFYQLKLASSWHSTFFASRPWEEEKERLIKKLEFLQTLNCKRINLSECTRTIHSNINIPLARKPSL